MNEETKVAFLLQAAFLFIKVTRFSDLNRIRFSNFDEVSLFNCSMIQCYQGYGRISYRFSCCPDLNPDTV